MIVLVDDIKLRESDVFFGYINSMFEGIDDLEKFSKFLGDTEEDIEFLISDYDEIEDKTFASKAMDVITAASDAKSNIKVSKM